MKTITLLLVAAAVLVAAPAALAKEVSALQACGASGCATLRDRAVLAGLTEAGPLIRPPAPAAWFRLRYTVTAATGETFENGTTSFSWTVRYVPAARAMWITGESGREWHAASPSAVAPLARLTRGLRPFGVPATASQPFPWGWLALAAVALVAAAASALLLRRHAEGRATATRPSSAAEA